MLTTGLSPLLNHLEWIPAFLGAILVYVHVPNGVRRLLLKVETASRVSECGHTLPAGVSGTHGNESLFLYTPHTRCKHQIVIIFNVIFLSLDEKHRKCSNPNIPSTKMLQQQR